MVTGKEVSEMLYGAALFVNAGLFVPQAWKIFREKSAGGASLITFGGFNCIQVIGLINGIYFRDYGLIVGMCLSIIACGMVTAQILRYKFWGGTQESLAK